MEGVGVYSEDSKKTAFYFLIVANTANNIFKSTDQGMKLMHTAVQPPPLSTCRTSHLPHLERHPYLEHPTTTHYSPPRPQPLPSDLLGLRCSGTSWCPLVAMPSQSAAD